MFKRLFIIAALVAFGALAGVPPDTAEAHRSGCHRYHSCPSDTGSYVCGDLGYSDYCPNKPSARPAPSTPKPIAPGRSTYPLIDWNRYEIPDSVVAYLELNGGLPVFGLPKTRASLDENGHLAWAFERYRLEFHSELINTPYVLQLGLLGEIRLFQIGRVWQNEPKADPKPGCRYFAETGHNICEPFLSYWRAHGIDLDGNRKINEAESMALFGMPITESTPEAGSDGVSRPTQWFQRARFEDHGNQGGVLLGLLGNEVFHL
jgi:hypothetical protein